MPVSQATNFENSDVAAPFAPGISISEILAKSAQTDFSLPVKICEICNCPKEYDKQIFPKISSNPNASDISDTSSDISESPSPRFLRLPIPCLCAKEKAEKRRIQSESGKQQERLQRFRAYSLADENFTLSTFENWQVRHDNQRLYKLGTEYCNNWEKVKKNNRGILFHGKAGCGKTYLSFAIANRLYQKGISSLAVSVSGILELIRRSYGGNAEAEAIGEMQIMQAITEVDLLILDDLGVEYKTFWGSDKFYGIINARYRAKKPLIITTNLDTANLESDKSGLQYSLALLDSKSGAYDTSNRIYDRIAEICTFVEVSGESWRTQKSEVNGRMLFEDLGI